MLLSLNSIDLYVVEVFGSGDLLLKMKETQFDFFEGKMEGPTWYMTPELINTPSKNKKSLFMFDPINHPEPFGNELRELMDLINNEIKKLPIYQKIKNNHEFNEAVGVHYYEGPKNNEKGGYLGDHLDVNLISIIGSDGPTSFWDGNEWILCSTNILDDPDYLIPSESFLVMLGSSSQLLGYGHAAKHKVPIINRDKFTFGMFLEPKNKKDFLLTLPSNKIISYDQYSNEYFDPNLKEGEIYDIKNKGTF